MTAAVLLRGGPTLYRVPLPDGPVAALALGEEGAVAGAVAEGYTPPLADRVVRWVRSSPGPSSTPEAALRARLVGAGLDVGETPAADLRRAVARLPTPDATRSRRFALALARARLARALASDEETLIALAREEERVERSVDRESGALDQFLSGPTGPLAEYRTDLAAHREEMDRHLTSLSERLDTAARRVVPNLSALVGSRVAARLVAVAGGRRALARIPAARLQLLGARRRPVGGHGPRYGLLYRAPRMSDVPTDRQGRLARSLAALAVIAVRADEFTHRDLASELTARRDRRITRLQARP